jgi:hypothetical protein
MEKVTDNTVANPGLLNREAQTLRCGTATTEWKHF